MTYKATLSTLTAWCLIIFKIWCFFSISWKLSSVFGHTRFLPNSDNMESCHISSLIINVITRYHHITCAPTNDLCSFKERSHFYVLSRAVDDPSLPQTSVRSMFAHTQERNHITAQSQAVIGPLPAQQITRTTYGSIQVCCFLALKGLFT